MSKSKSNKYTNQYPEQNKFSGKSIKHIPALSDSRSGRFVINTDINLIRFAIKDGFINELALLHFLKFRFKNSRIYNINRPKERVAELAGLTVPTVYKYFDTLGYYGLIRPQRFGWQLARIKTKFKCKIYINEDSTLLEIKRLLFLKVMEAEGKKQAIIESLKDFHLKYLTDSDGKQKNKIKLSKYCEPFAAVLSVRYISKILNISNVTTLRLIRDLNYEGLIKTNRPGPEYLFDAGSEVLAHLEDYLGYRYCQNGSLYKIDASAHEFILNPLECKEMTSQHYKQLMKNPKMQKISDEILQLIENEDYFKKV